MTYDDTAKKLAVKVIGTVESDLNYGAINYNDPITVGVAQWYGTRAANVLNVMRTTNAGEWYGVAPSLNNQLIGVGSSSSFWNTRYLTRAEGDSLVPVLQRNQAIQNAVLTTDLDVYKDVAVSYGFDPEANTATVIYFFSMHHQSPASALEVVQTLDTTATLAQIHAATLAHPVLGQYGARYRATYDLISVADLTGVDPVPVEPEPVDPVNGNVRYITMVGDQLHVRFLDAETVMFLPDGRGHWIGKRPSDPPPVVPPVQPEPPSGAWVHPLPGSSLTSGYGPRGTPGGTANINGGFHWGSDLAGNGGNVLAPCDLVITVARAPGEGPDSGTAGAHVKGHTPDNAYTFAFMHMVADSIAVSVGDTVTAGTVLGVEGATGNVTGRHLHLECYNGALNDPWAPPYGNPIDPLPVLRTHGVII